MNLLILEDEQPAADKLRAFVRQYDATAHVLAVVPHVGEAREWLRTHPAPDLILSDIELLGGNVFPLYQERLAACPVIFTTAYDTFFMQAFEQNGIAYLLKPFQYAQFCAAMRKYEQLKTVFQQDALLRLAGSWTRPEKTYKQRFTVRVKDGLVLLATADISYVQLRHGLTVAHNALGHRYPLAENLSQLEELLNPGHFFRLNRSEIVSLAAIERLEPYFDEALAVHLRHPAGVVLIASASRTPKLRKWLNE